MESIRLRDCETSARRRKNPSELSTTPAGVNVVGFFKSELGIGEGGRSYAQALTSMGLDVALIDVSGLSSNRAQDDRFTQFSTDNPHPVNLICANPDVLPIFCDAVGSEFMAGRYNIGHWAWELPEIPTEWHDCFGNFDELWVSSAFVADAIGKSSPIPVVRIPFVVEPAVAQESLPLPGDEYRFLFVFDYMSSIARKNPLALIDAFRKAFSSDEPVRLIIKSINGYRFPDQSSLVQDACAGARITLLDDYLSRPQLMRLIADCDCFVSLHHSEGWGFAMAEAMYLSKPVIATGWSGNLDFMNVSNSYLVPYEIREITSEDKLYAKGQSWAEADVDEAARLMRQVFSQPEQAVLVGRRAADHIRRNHSADAVAAEILKRLDRLAAMGKVSRHGSDDCRNAAGDRVPAVSQFKLLDTLQQTVFDLSRAWVELDSDHRELVSEFKSLEHERDLYKARWQRLVELPPLRPLFALYDLAKRGTKRG